LMTHK